MLSTVKIYDIKSQKDGVLMSQLSGVSMHFVSALLEGLKGDKAMAARLMEVSGIAPSGSETRVTSGAYATLMRLVAQTLDDEFFGRDTRRVKQGSFAMLCHAVIACRSLERALARALRFYGLLLDDVVLNLREHEGQLRLELADPKRRSTLFAHENLLLFLHRLACWLVNRRIAVTNIGFCFPEPKHASEYPLVFGVMPQFAQSRSWLAFDLRYAALPVIRDESALKEFLALAPENLFVRYRPSHGTAQRVRRNLVAMPLADWPAFEDVARSLGMSASTLHRRLADEDTSFQEIKDQIRRDRAMTLLRQKDRSVSAIAEELGFAEPSAFHRAFRKWSGAAPGQYRRARDGMPD
jgi:AraC-like DNA-binding protein